MKAVVLREHGGLDKLEYVTDFPDPVATEGHVVIRVRATSFNYHDVFTVRGMPGIKVPLPMIIGLDMAGEILEVGPGVIGWQPGDRVLVNPLNRQKGLMGEMMHGGLAEKCLVAEPQLIRMPQGVSFEQAASLPVAYGTAHRMIYTHDTIHKGEKVLVLGRGSLGIGREGADHAIGAPFRKRLLRQNAPAIDHRGTDARLEVSGRERGIVLPRSCDH